jgi:hypothetical protein
VEWCSGEMIALFPVDVVAVSTQRPRINIFRNTRVLYGAVWDAKMSLNLLFKSEMGRNSWALGVKTRSPLPEDTLSQQGYLSCPNEKAMRVKSK